MRRSISILSISLFALLFITTSSANAQIPPQGQWYEDDSDLNWDQIMGSVGYYNLEFSLIGAGAPNRFHVAAKYLRTPDRPSYVERVRFLVSASTDSLRVHSEAAPHPCEAINYGALFTDTSTIGIAIATEGRFDNFWTNSYRAVVPNVESIQEQPISEAVFDCGSSTNVDITETKIRVVANPDFLRDYDGPAYYANGLFSIEIILDNPIRLPSNADVRLIPFIRDWDNQYQPGFVVKRRTAAPGQVKDKWTQYVQATTDLPPTLYNALRTLCPGGGSSFCRGVRFSDDDDTLAVGLRLKPIRALSAGFQGTFVRFNGDHARCMFPERSSDGQNWFPINQPVGGTLPPGVAPLQLTESNSIFEFDVTQAPTQYFRLVERDSSNYKNAECTGDL